MRQPCNPTFLSARDAIIEADKSFYGGANKCEIIKGFAKRGLGLNANNFRNDFSVPKECSGASPNPAPVPVPVPVPQTPPTKGGPKKTVTKRGPKKTVTKDEPKKTVKRGPKKTVTKRGPKKTATKRGPKKTIKRRPKKTATKRGPKPTKLPRTPGNLKCDPNNICCFYLGFDC
ncbi:extracellular metalloproteinase MEP [Batrachochytrium salamandrivorans]|nr:extracellular metalloproteinase MEP [Batrachochytrium salamandrivorans]